MSENSEAVDLTEALQEQCAETKPQKRGAMKIFKSKTIIFSLLLALLGVVEASFQVFAPMMTPQAYGLMLMGVSCVVAVLRIVTTLPLDDK